MIEPAKTNATAQTDAKHRSRSVGRKFKFVIVAAVLLCALWAGGWFWANRIATERIAAMKADFIAEGGVIGCTADQLGGFPFKFSIDCTPASLELPARGFSASVGALEAIALIYNPGHVLASLRGPLELQAQMAQGLGPIDVEANWSSLETSVRVGTSRLKRFSAVADDLTSTISAPADPRIPTAARAKHAELHLLQNDSDATALDLATTVDGFAATIPGAPTLPDLSAKLYAILPGALPELRDRHVDPLPAWLAAGGQVKLGQLSIDIGGFLANASGDLTVARDGVISGRVAIRVDQLEKLPDLAETIHPGSRNRVAQILGPLSAFLKPVQVDGKTWRETTLTIKNGRVSAGFIPLGRLPPLKLGNAAGIAGS
ncbi:DUF2125 domain-containing protein [Kaistia terrae]|uniref:DUF2125 domain-containing protein n=1 Tax=Kaistia terrae TaxID=537017 RepID=A0ABW0Q3A3_9HYPH|nr:DUF2125 domain-containing protein [Kaistia terrae]MCX5579884.1 DUF2125 domain-containing protein [Kaistia terrae]